ncbi:NUDIX domain-containing protein [Citrobacter sp. JGM124]|uniref:NUDIX hydrolase n=1 Tax=Citrobacter sp. JGM124 TaxID=2799789 RepID=UPI001BA5E227|nr:NUDIX domain-containing protein [Citrobacter sp. JGM124]MBS0848080.1 NUDIX domain-containing protein [Citrobacter sp. JGM124]
MPELKKIHVSAAVITDAEGRMLLVRKRNTDFFMQPGGKIEPGEAPEVALIRELYEELQIEVQPENMVSLGQYTDIAANEPDHIIVADMFRVNQFSGDVLSAAEIEDVVWFSQTDNNIMLAPLTLNKIIPLLNKADMELA